jgi:hypothetical protein
MQKKQRQSLIIEEINGQSIRLMHNSTIPLCISMIDQVEFRIAIGGDTIHIGWDNGLMSPDVVKEDEIFL